MEIHFEKVTSDNRKAVENLQVFAEPSLNQWQKI